MDPSLPPAAVKSRVESVMSTLGLTHIRNNTVLSGTGASGVSGGERRRVAIGMELVIDPQVSVGDVAGQYHPSIRLVFDLIESRGC